MSTKNTKWANRTKDALAAVPTSAVVVKNDGFEDVGTNNFEPIVAYYQFTVPKSDRGRQINVGDEFIGSYDGSFKGKTYGNLTHKLKTAEGIIGLPSAGQLDKLLGQVAPGTLVKVTYKGKQLIKDGKFAGKQAHGFSVAQKRS